MRITSRESIRYTTLRARQSPFLASLLIAVLVGGCTEPDVAEEVGLEGEVPSTEVEEAESPPELIEMGFESYVGVEAYLEEIGYTIERWSAGIREIPPLFISDIPPRWRDRNAQEMSVLAKKQLFFRLMAPMVLAVNEDILRTRSGVEARAALWDATGNLSQEDADWLQEVAADYAVELSGDVTAADTFTALLERVDAIPVSLVLAQGAEESGWGTSRFAAEGNAIFGQWSWGENIIRPENQRSGMGDYGIAAFDTPLDSVRAYMTNLNTHPAYAPLRQMRSENRERGQRTRGFDLATTLVNYSERGAEYVDSLHAIMRVNRLADTDDAFMSDRAPVLMIPVGEGVD